MIFDIKMEDFRQKACLVAGGRMTDAPDVMTYVSVVPCKTLCIALTITALDDLKVKVDDIMNTYVTTPVTENIQTVLGPEFGADAGKKADIVCLLYGLKSTGAVFYRHLADCMERMGYKSCLKDSDLCCKPMVRPVTDMSIITTFSATQTTSFVSIMIPCPY